MVLFGPSHVAVMAVTVVIALGVVVLARRTRDPGLIRVMALALAAVLLMDRLIAGYLGFATVGVANALPMHLCDWTVIAAIIALVWRRKLAFELTYFWGLAGTLQAILTPDLAFDFPDLRFFIFFISHGGVLVVIAFLALGLRMRPWPWSLVRIFLWSNIYLAAALLVNLILGTNYGYLSAKPAHPSLLDYLGPWPLYILSLEVLAMVSFGIYYLPYLLRDRLAKSR